MPQPVIVENPARWTVIVGDVTIPAGAVEPGKIGQPGRVELDRATFDRHEKQLRAWQAKGALTIRGA